MKHHLLKLLIVNLLLGNIYSATACSVFMANDGQNVWIGNNEDELQNLKYRMWFYPAQKRSFGYAIWTDLNIKIKSLNRLNPQGGLNENGFWTCEVLLPKGEVIYKFIVNKEYLADNKNYMHIGEGPKIYSKVYVW